MIDNTIAIDGAYFDYYYCFIFNMRCPLRELGLDLFGFPLAITGRRKHYNF
jgi:hypothetical protein